MVAVEGRGAAPPGAAPRPSTAAEAHSSTAQPAGQPAGSVLGRLEQRASDSERERTLFAIGMHLNFTKFTVNFRKFELKLHEVHR